MKWCLRLMKAVQAEANRARLEGMQPARGLASVTPQGRPSASLTRRGRASGKNTQGSPALHPLLEGRENCVVVRSTPRSTTFRYSMGKGVNCLVTLPQSMLNGKPKRKEAV